MITFEVNLRCHGTLIISWEFSVSTLHQKQLLWVPSALLLLPPGVFWSSSQKQGTCSPPAITGNIKQTSLYLLVWWSSLTAACRGRGLAITVLFTWRAPTTATRCSTLTTAYLSRLCFRFRLTAAAKQRHDEASLLLLAGSECVWKWLMYDDWIGYYYVCIDYLVMVSDFGCSYPTGIRDC